MIGVVVGVGAWLLVLGETRRDREAEDWGKNYDKLYFI